MVHSGQTVQYNRRLKAHHAVSTHSIEDAKPGENKAFNRSIKLRLGGLVAEQAGSCTLENVRLIKRERIVRRQDEKLRKS